MIEEVEAGVQFITPELAKKYFEMNDPDNRPIDLSFVENYLKMMNNGEWKDYSLLGFSYYDKYLING